MLSLFRDCRVALLSPCIFDAPPLATSYRMDGRHTSASALLFAFLRYLLRSSIFSPSELDFRPKLFHPNSSLSDRVSRFHRPTSTSHSNQDITHKCFSSNFSLYHRAALYTSIPSPNTRHSTINRLQSSTPVSLHPALRLNHKSPPAPNTSPFEHSILVFSSTDLYPHS